MLDYSIRLLRKGFTLIELVVVVVILGVLAVASIPKMFNATDDARVSVLESISGALYSTAELVNQKAILAKKTASSDESEFVSVSGNNIVLVFGYPNAETISEAISISGSTWIIKSDTAKEVAIMFPPDVNSGNNSLLTVSGNKVTDDDVSQCYALYKEAVANTGPTILTHVEDC